MLKVTLRKNESIEEWLKRVEKRNPKESLDIDAAAKKLLNEMKNEQKDNKKKKSRSMYYFN